MSTLKTRVLAALDAFADPSRRAEYLTLYAPDAVLHGYQGVEPGFEGIRRFYEGIWLAFPDARVETHEMIGEGDFLAMRFTMHATHLGPFQDLPATGRPIALAGITLLRFAHGQCVERWSQADFLGLLVQLGALPAPAGAS
jgi:predicted ester cyclase